MSKFTFPVQTSGTPGWPMTGKCPCCDKELNGTFVYFNGGALLKDSETSESASISPLLSGFLNIGFHPRHDDPDQSKHDVHVDVDVADRVSHGQFEFSFCSPACLRTFLNDCVNSLEETIAEARLKKGFVAE